MIQDGELDNLVLIMSKADRTSRWVRDGVYKFSFELKRYVSLYRTRYRSYTIDTA